MLKRIVILLLANIFIMCLPLVTLWLLKGALHDQWEAFNSGRQLIIHSSYEGFMPGAILFLLIASVYIFTLTFFEFRKIEVTKNHHNIFAKIFYAPMAVAFILTFVGHFAINSFYRHHMSSLGYQRCPDTALLFARVTYSAWVKDPVLCHDSDVRRIVRRGHWDESFQVERMLEQRIQREEVRVQRQQREAERQEARRQREALEREQG